MKSTLKHGVRKHYAKQSLDQNQLEQLEAIYTNTADTIDTSATTDTHVTGERLTRTGEFYPKLAAIAATVLLAVSLLFFSLPQSNEKQIMAIATEVAKEHLHQNPLGVSSPDFTVVQNYFRKLDFMPNVSSHFGSSDQLLGGRYCSIKNITAAQIRYQSTNSPDTLYQVSYDPDHFGLIPDLSKGEIPLVRHVKGVKMEMWVEKGLLMVGARTH